MIKTYRVTIESYYDFEADSLAEAVKEGESFIRQIDEDDMCLEVFNDETQEWEGAR